MAYGTMYALKYLEYEGRSYAKGDRIEYVTSADIEPLVAAGDVGERYPFGVEPSPSDVRGHGSRRQIRLFAQPGETGSGGSWVDEEERWNFYVKYGRF